MVNRSAIFMFILLFASVVHAPRSRASGDQITYNNCMAEKMDGLRKFCTDPGDSGVIAECMKDAEGPLRASAHHDCNRLARGEMAGKAAAAATEDAVDPNAIDAADTGTVASTNCIPSARDSCARNAPLPPRRPVAATAARPAPTPPRRPSAATPSTPTRTATTTTPRAQQSPTTQTDRNNREAVASARNTTPQSEASAGAQASNDLSLCESSFSAASRCCGSPTSCVNEMPYQDQANFAQMNSLMNQSPPRDSQGLNDYCQQMQELGGSSRSVNTSLAGVCNSKQMSCSMVCSQLADKYETLLSNCNGCDSQYIYQNAYNSLSSRTTGCNQFQSRVNQIANQAWGANGSQGAGEACSRVASSNPQNGLGSNPVANAGTSAFAANAGSNSNDPYGCAANPSSAACQSCAQNPNSAACRALNTKDSSGTAQFAAGEGTNKKSDGSGFDIPDTPSGGTERVLNTPNEAQPGSRNGTVANNSGGGIPGGDGVAPAKLGGSPGGASPGSPGYSTDVLQGMQGASGYSQPVESNSSGNSFFSNFFGGGRKPANEVDNAMLGLDLRQFLPGGSRDPKRRLAGFGVRSEINAKEEDIWRIISTKMEEKCKLGVLIGCR
jgi:hypothetical protein